MPGLLAAYGRLLSFGELLKVAWRDPLSGRELGR